MHINYDMAGDSYLNGPETPLHYVTSNLKVYHCIHRIISLRERENMFVPSHSYVVLVAWCLLSKPDSKQPRGNITLDSKK